MVLDDGVVVATPAAIVLDVDAVTEVVVLSGTIVVEVVEVVDVVVVVVVVLTTVWN